MKNTAYILLVLFVAALAHAASVNLTADNASGSSGFNGATGWSNGLAPAAGNSYFTKGYLLRTPSAAGSYTFAGDSLTIGIGTATPIDTNHNFRTDGTVNNNGLMSKTPSSPTITVANLILDAGYIRDGMGDADVWTVAGNVTVTANGGGIANQCRLNLAAVIGGSGNLYVADNSNGNSNRITYIQSALNTYNGTIYMLGSAANRCRLTFDDNSRMNFVIGAAGVNNKITVGSGKFGTLTLNGDFDFDLAGAGTNMGDSWTIVGVPTPTYGATFTVVGFTDEGNGLWTKSANGVAYKFDKSTGVLSVYLPQLIEDPISGFAGIELPLTNGGFALPLGTTTTGLVGVPGWFSHETTWDADTGIRLGSAAGEATDGDNQYWSEDCNEDGPIWNIADVNMVAGTTYTFTADVQGRWLCDTVTVDVIAGNDPNTALASKVVSVASESNGIYFPATISYTATASDAGKKIGVKFDGEDDWMRLDNVHLFKDYVEFHGVIDHAPDGANVEPATPLVLSWTPASDPNFNDAGGDDQILYYYISNGDGSDPDYTSYLGVSGVSKGFAGDSHAVAGGIQPDQYCLWRVDTVIDGDTYTGKTILFSTRTADEKPILTPGDNWVTWVDEQVTVTGDVNDFGEGDVADGDNVWSIVNPTPWVAAMQMYNHAGDADLAALTTAGYDAALLEDWIGTDARGNLAGVEPLTLTLSGVPAGTYTWTSYHHDVADQTGPFSVTVIDAAGSATTAGVDVTDGAATPVGTFSTTITSNGSPIQLLFDNTGTENNTSFFVMNGFVLSDGINPDLKVDFGTAANAIAVGYQAYTAEHEVQATFTTQNFSALGTTVSVTPTWDSSSYYATVTDASSDPLAPAATFVSNFAADYTIQLNSTDRGGSVGDQAADPVSVAVRVGRDACDAMVLSGATHNAYDSDQDCDVDMVDFAAFAAQWLEDIKLTGPVGTE